MRRAAAREWPQWPGERLPDALVQRLARPGVAPMPAPRPGRRSRKGLAWRHRPSTTTSLIFKRLAVSNKLQLVRLLGANGA